MTSGQFGTNFEFIDGLENPTKPEIIFSEIKLINFLKFLKTFKSNFSSDQDEFQVCSQAGKPDQTRSHFVRSLIKKF